MKSFGEWMKDMAGTIPDASEIKPSVPATCTVQYDDDLATTLCGWLVYTGHLGLRDGLTNEKIDLQVAIWDAASVADKKWMVSLYKEFIE